MGEARDTVPWIKGREREGFRSTEDDINLWLSHAWVCCLTCIYDIYAYACIYVHILTYIYTHIHTSHLIQNIDIVPLFISPVITVISNNSSRWSRVLELNSCIGCRTRWFTFLLEELGPLKSCPLGTCGLHAFYAVDWAACTPVASIVAC